MHPNLCVCVFFLLPPGSLLSPMTLDISWSPTYSEYFAISTRSPAKGALIHVHNINYVHAQPTVFTINPRPHSVADFDFLGMRGIPRIVAAVGRNVHVFTIGVDS